MRAVRLQTSAPDSEPTPRETLPEVRPLMVRLSKAAELTGLSEDFLRKVPDLPKLVIRGAGAKDSRASHLHSVRGSRTWVDHQPRR